MGSAFRQKSLGAVSKVSGQTPTGSINGSNTSFTTSSSFVAGSLAVYKNGVRLKAGVGNDYTESGANTFVMATAPITGTQIVVDYYTVQTTTGNADTVDGIHANSTATANSLYPLNSSSQFPSDVIGTNELGYAEVTASQTGITTLADLTGLSVTVTVPTLVAGKKVIIEGWIPQIYSTVATDRADFAIREGSTALAYAYGAAQASSTGWGGATIKCRISPTAGSHTYKLSLARGVGSGSLATYADSTTKAFIRVTVE